MRRRTFDLLVSWVGVLLTVALVVAGGMLFAGYKYANNNVTEQLTAQKIFFPDAGNEQFADPRIGPYIEQYAGEQVVNGAQAKAFALHYLGVHLEEMGMTYSEASSASRADPENEELAGMVQTLFRGETLKGLLLNAYAFWVFGQLALWGAIGAWAAGLFLGILTVLGFRHARKVAPEVEIGSGKKSVKAVEAVAS
jgi:hypothetical protein